MIRKYIVVIIQEIYSGYQTEYIVANIQEYMWYHTEYIVVIMRNIRGNMWYHTEIYSGYHSGNT